MKKREDPKGSKTTEEVVEEFISLVNTYSDEEAATKISAVIRRSHRTLQQSMFRAIVQLLLDWSQDAQGGYCDARNEFTVETAAKIVDHLREWGVIYKSSDGKSRVAVPLV